MVEAAGLRQAAVILVGRALGDGGVESHLYGACRTRSAAPYIDDRTNSGYTDRTGLGVTIGAE